MQLGGEVRAETEAGLAFYYDFFAGRAHRVGLGPAQ